MSQKTKNSINSNLKGLQSKIEDPSNESKYENNFSEILNKNWKVFRISPLYNFNQNKLKRYGYKLSEELNATRKLNSKIIYKCTFSLSENLRQNENCTEAIKVVVCDNLSKPIYCGYFISWANEKEVNNDCISVPILLVNSKGLEMETIHLLICKMFDCIIQPVIFPFYMLISFFVNQLQCPRKKSDASQDLIFLEYKIPGCKTSDRLKVSLFLQDTTIIFAMIIDNLREQYEQVKNREIVLEFYNRIMSHIYNVYQMELLLAELYKIAIPDAFITTDGQVKMSTNEVALILLNDLHNFSSIEKMINM